MIYITMAPSQVPIRDPQSIHHQASPAYYSENTFMLDDPSFALRWLEQIGQDNIKHLAKLRIFPSAVYNLGPYPSFSGAPASGPKWCELFDTLANKAIGLREIYIYWDAEPTCWHFGGGFDVDVVRALARIQGLQKLEIAGFFAKEWPAYLEGKLGMKVWGRQGQEEWYLKALRKFQRDLRDLSP
jgi:hypothetical protein